MIRPATGKKPAPAWAPWAIGFFFFASWEIASRLEWISPLFFPAPTFILETIGQMLASGELGGHLLATLHRLLLGFFLGGTIGLSLGILMGWSSRARQVFDPLVAALHPVPKISIFPLLIIVFGVGAFAKSVVIAIAAFFPMVINTTAGVRQISPIYYEVAENYGASRWQVFRHVILPGSAPMILAGVRLALNLSLSITTAIELLMGRDGLGSIIWLSWQTLRTEELFAAVFCLALIGVSFRLLTTFLAAWLVPWQDAPGRRKA